MYNPLVYLVPYLLVLAAGIAFWDTPELNLTGAQLLLGWVGASRNPSKLQHDTLTTIEFSDLGLVGREHNQMMS